MLRLAKKRVDESFTTPARHRTTSFKVELVCDDDAACYAPNSENLLESPLLAITPRRPVPRGGEGDSAALSIVTPSPGTDDDDQTPIVPRDRSSPSLSGSPFFSNSAKPSVGAVVPPHSPPRRPSFAWAKSPSGRRASDILNHFTKKFRGFLRGIFRGSGEKKKEGKQRNEDGHLEFEEGASSVLSQQSQRKKRGEAEFEKTLATMLEEYENNLRRISRVEGFGKDEEEIRKMI
jgi:hypothetical protein